MSSLYVKGLEYVKPLQSLTPRWLKQIKADGEMEKVPIVGDDMGLFIRMICSLTKPESILEIGCGISYATHWMLLGHQKSEITALDSNQERLDQCDKYLRQSGLRERVTLKHCWAEDFFEANTHRYDLIFQDSTKKNYVNMIDHCYNSLKAEGLLIVDNIFFGGKVFGLTRSQKKKYARGVSAIRSFNKQMALHEGFECFFFPISDGVLIAKRIS